MTNSNRRSLGACVGLAVLVAALASKADGPAPAPTAAALVPATALVVLAGDISKAGPISLEELKALGPVEKTWTAHGQSHKVVGVRLDRLLGARGFAPGPMGKEVPKNEKRAGWRKVVLVSAADGYQALLSCAEMAEEMGPTIALLVWEIDGAPLLPDQGPLRLVVITDQEPSRSIYAVRKIELIDVAALAAKRN